MPLNSKVFVYGTLLKGMRNSLALRQSNCLGPMVIKANLYDLDSYPGIQKGTGTVIGEVYEVNESTLQGLDILEGYCKNDPKQSLFTREVVQARSLADGQPIKCFVYYYHHPVHAENSIVHGDYRRYRLEQKFPKEQWIVAYGSNISQTRIMNRVGTVSGLRVGYLNDFQLVFNKRSYNQNTARANIQYTEGGHCPAVAWRLSNSQIQELDMNEGTPHHYLRIAIPFVTDQGTHILQAYVAHPDKLGLNLVLDEEYVGHIWDGYEEQGLDLGYLVSIFNHYKNK